MLLFFIAGPLANLLLASLLLTAGIYRNELSTIPRRVNEVTPASIPWMPQTYANAWLYSAAVMNLMLFFLNLIPGTGKGLTTDGAKFLELLRGGPYRRASFTHPDALGRLPKWVASP